MNQNRHLARQLADDALRHGSPLKWFERLYLEANGNASSIPWADLQPNPNLVEWFDRSGLKGSGKRALVIGCGLGDDAEFLASVGFNVVAFDISATCIDWCHQRFSQSPVSYEVADLLNEIEQFGEPFDFVFEAYTLQVLPAELRSLAIDRISSQVKKDGTLLVITRGRDLNDDRGNMPWPLVRSELHRFENSGLREIEFDDYVEQEDPPVRRFRVEYRRH